MDFETPPPPPQPPQDQPPEPPEAPKRGRARERYERRRQHVAPRPPGSAPRQIRLPQQVKLPTIRLPRGTGVLLGVLGALAFVVILVVALGRLRNDTPATAPNAVWLGTEWTYEDHTDADIAGLVAKLRSRGIGTIYAYLTYLQFDGTWRNEDKFDNVKTFVKQFKTAYPESQLYGLIGVPTSDAAHPPRLDDVNLQQQVATLAKQSVTDMGFQGVFIDAEPVWDGDQSYLALLRAVRAAVGITMPISAAIPPDWSPSNVTFAVPPQIEPGTEWRTEYKQSVALLVDHMAVMVFNSGLSSASDYEQWVAYQVKTYADAIAQLDTKTDLLIGVPTFDAEPPGHDPAVENIDTAVQGVDLGLQQAGDAASYVKGLAVYADWTTDDTEWADFQKVWVDKQ